MFAAVKQLGMNQQADEPEDQEYLASARLNSKDEKEDILARPSLQRLQSGPSSAKKGSTSNDSFIHRTRNNDGRKERIPFGESYTQSDNDIRQSVSKQLQGKVAQTVHHTSQKGQLVMKKTTNMLMRQNDKENAGTSLAAPIMGAYTLNER